MKRNILKAIWPFIWWVLTMPVLGIARLLLIITGLVVVFFAVPFSKAAINNSPLVQQGGVEKYRRIKILPSWAWLWSNDHDGILGDRRGSWDIRWGEVWWPKLKWLECTGLVKPHVDCFMAKYIWAAWRNPVNNLRFTKFYQCDLTNCGQIYYIGTRRVSDRINMAGMHLVWAYPERSLLPYVGLYGVKMWSKKQTNCIRGRFGFKIDVHDKGKVGFTTLLVPWKSVHK